MTSPSLRAYSAACSVQCQAFQSSGAASPKSVTNSNSSYTTYRPP